MSVIIRIAPDPFEESLTFASIIMDIEDRLKIMRKQHRPPTNLGFFPYDGNVLGGSLIGIGMAVTGVRRLMGDGVKRSTWLPRGV